MFASAATSVIPTPKPAVWFIFQLMDSSYYFSQLQPSVHGLLLRSIPNKSSKKHIKRQHANCQGTKIYSTLPFSPSVAFLSFLTPVEKKSTQQNRISFCQQAHQTPPLAKIRRSTISHLIIPPKHQMLLPIFGRREKKTQNFLCSEN